MPVQSPTQRSFDPESAAEAVGVRPETAVRLMQLSDDDDATAEQIREVVDADPSMAMRTLKLANSALYGMRSRISRIDRALTMLGCAQIARLAASASLATAFQKMRLNVPGITRDTLWRYSASVAFSTETVIEECQGMASVARRKLAAETFVIGLIHDVGILVQAKLAEQPFTDAVNASLKSGVPLVQNERRRIGIDHAEIGGRLAEHWSLPPQLISGIAFHHNPMGAPSEHRTTACVLHIAVQLVRKAGTASFDGDVDMPELDEAMHHVRLDARRVDQYVSAVQTRLMSVQF